MKNNEYLMVKLPKELKDEIKDTAKKRYQTISDYVRGLITKDLKGRK